jgi:hypothetical protein
VLNDFAAQVQSTLQPQFEDNRWERESVDSLETSNQYPPTRTTGPIVRSKPVLNVQPSSNPDQQELLRRSYHESFFVKNTPVTGDEQVTAWLGVNRATKQTNLMEKAPSLDGNEPKSILKRSPSLDSQSMARKPTKKDNPPPPPPPPARPSKEKVRVKDSLEVINAKMLKELDIQVETTERTHIKDIPSFLDLEKDGSIRSGFSERTLCVRYSTCY